MSLDIDQQIFESIRNAKSILLTVPDNYSGDCLSGMLGFYNYLISKKNESNIDFILPQKPKKIHNFLPNIENAKFEDRHLRRLVFSVDTTKTKIKEINYTEEGNKLKIFLDSNPFEIDPKDVLVYFANYYDLILVFNSPDLKSIGKTFLNHVDFFQQVPVINIDNEASNERYGQINFIDIGSSCISEQIFNLLYLNKKQISKEIAECLFTGLVLATKGFSNQKVTPRILDIAGKLIEQGADREKIISNIYRTKSISLLKVWGQILSELNYDQNYKIAWSTLELEDTEENKIEIDDLVEEIVSKASQAEVVALFQVLKEDLSRIYIYSNYKHDSIGLVSGLVGNNDFLGNCDLLSFEVRGDVSEVRQKVLDILKVNISKNI
ncbi:MAG: DHH family phosphoesterase [Patescibacteria group bacterium]|nr:DHH family phosphoesterase [Patescibacteria group bacterium]MDD4303890.1 DHH family phosphoesterase [Patescibacteria group bacterium]MDD4695123.1 DHH family phosphoesterase [Patescibacteria group bacterium]